MLQAQLAQLQRQQAEESMPEQGNAQAVEQSVNKPSSEHKIDIYI
jgi:hypothetical protein